mmetsp:Transcript_66326/g.191454  ORF Transcript_66326/g.191454 Transcript_66326/m.191454 type:complete len:351 (+) Transcript_66326:1754-2806(+)
MATREELLEGPHLQDHARERLVAIDRREDHLVPELLSYRLRLSRDLLVNGAQVNQGRVRDDEMVCSNHYFLGVVLDAKHAGALEVVGGIQKQLTTREEVPRVLEDLERDDPARQHALQDLLSRRDAPHDLGAREGAVQEKTDRHAWTPELQGPGRQEEVEVVDPDERALVLDHAGLHYLSVVPIKHLVHLPLGLAELPVRVLLVDAHRHIVEHLHVVHHGPEEAMAEFQGLCHNLLVEEDRNAIVHGQSLGDLPLLIQVAREHARVANEAHAADELVGSRAGHHRDNLEVDVVHVAVELDLPLTRLQPLEAARQRAEDQEDNVLRSDLLLLLFPQLLLKALQPRQPGARQ